MEVDEIENIQKEVENNAIDLDSVSERWTEDYDDYAVTDSYPDVHSRKMDKVVVMEEVIRPLWSWWYFTAANDVGKHNQRNTLTTMLK